MPPASLLTLPTELLDRIAVSLDWDRSASLIPFRPDLHALSLTCKHLRDATLPLLFRNVTLSLRWQDGVLLEPMLYQLRRRRPHLARHIRGVFIVSRVGAPIGTKPTETEDFRIPDTEADWLDHGAALRAAGSRDDRFDAELQEAHRKRVVQAVCALCAEYWKVFVTPPTTPQEAAETASDSVSSPKTVADDLTPGHEDCRIFSAEEQVESMLSDCTQTIARLLPKPPPIRQRVRRVNSDHDAWSLEDDESNATTGIGTWRRHQRGYHRGLSAYPDAGPELWQAQRKKLEIDALATLMLCLPPTVSEVVFEAGMHGLDDQPWYHFACFLLHFTMDVLGHRISSLTMATGAGGRRAITRSDGDIVEMSSFVAQLTAVKRLVLASTSAARESFNVHSLHTSASQLEQWDHPNLHETVTHLELWNTNLVDMEFNQVVTFLSHFGALKALSFDNLSYATRGTTSRIWPTTSTPPSGPPILLDFAVNLRRAISSDTHITFRDISCSSRGTRTKIPSDALRWLMEEAVPVGTEIDFQRVERLAEDWESMLFLWECDGSELGKEAREWKGWGALVDQAMTSRSKQFNR